MNFVRPAELADLPAIARLIRALADYEKLAVYRLTGDALNQLAKKARVNEIPKSPRR